jgi:hypothetical protein
MIDEAKKSQYWDHFTGEPNKSFRPKKITDVRLKQIRELVLEDEFLWQKFISRHHALNKSPVELKETSPSNYRQARANFWAMIRGKIQLQLNQLSG